LTLHEVWLAISSATFNIDLVMTLAVAPKSSVATQEMGSQGGGASAEATSPLDLKSNARMIKL
jgi:hypothetical protein